MINFERVRIIIENYNVNGESREKHAEVHTPFELIEKKLDKLPENVWLDEEKTWLDPSAGIGNYTLVIAERLMEGLETKFPDPDRRYKHIMEEQIFMVELQIKNCIMIEKLFNPTGELNLNLKCCDTLNLDIDYMKKDDWKTERFRENYRYGDGFWKRGPSMQGAKKLEKIKELTDNEQIISQFERGYEDVEPVFNRTG